MPNNKAGKLDTALTLLTPTIFPIINRRHKETPTITPPWEIKRKLVVKAEEETDPRFGHKPSERPIEEHIRFGVINLDKPAGPSSHEVTAWVKRLLSLRHAGHGGTLEAPT